MVKQITGTLIALVAVMVVLLVIPFALDSHQILTTDTVAEFTEYLQDQGYVVLADGTMGYAIAAANSPDWCQERAQVICDSTDAYQEIQGAIHALPANGGSIECAPGDYPLPTNTLSFVSEDVHRISFSAWGANFNVTGNHSAMEFTTTAVPYGSFHQSQFEGFTIDGNKGNQSGQHGIHIIGGPTNDDYVSRITFRNIQIQEMGGSGVRVDNSLYIHWDNIFSINNDLWGFDVQAPAGVTRTHQYFERCDSQSNGAGGFNFQRITMPHMVNCQSVLDKNKSVAFSGCQACNMQSTLIETSDNVGLDLWCDGGVIAGTNFAMTSGNATPIVVGGNNLRIIGINIKDTGGGAPYNADVWFRSPSANNTVSNISLENTIRDDGTNNIVEGPYGEQWGVDTGNGTQRAIAHGLYAAPEIVSCGGNETDANCYQSQIADGTNIYITADNGEGYWWYAAVR